MKDMKEIDFSSKHNFIIRNTDGTYQPMDEPYFEPFYIAEGTWRILTDGDYSYLVEGEEEAIAIDSGYGCGNIRAMMQTLTKKPLRRVANTHEHFDHTANNGYFECALMSENAVDKATIPTPTFDGICFPRDYPKKIVRPGDQIELGRRTLEVFGLTDHTDAGIVFLDKRERILFSGDELWPDGPRILTGSVERFARQIQKLVQRRADFDYLCTGFGEPADASIVDRLWKNAAYILNGGKCVPVSMPKEFCKVKETEYDEHGRIVYDRRVPRSGDHMGAPFFPENAHMAEYAGCQIIFDINRVSEKFDKYLV